MDHDGPKSSKNQKRATAAEKLAKLQEDYEAMEKSSPDKMQPVLTHNETYPKLRAQLKRKRSLADVADVRKPRLTNKSKPRKKPRKPRGRRDKRLSRITKKRPRHCTCSRCLSTMLLNTKSCQNCIAVMSRRIGTDPGGPPVPVTKFPREPDETSMEPAGSRVDSGSDKSVSSFHSYNSMDHEPMV